MTFSNDFLLDITCKPTGDAPHGMHESFLPLSLPLSILNFLPRRKTITIGGADDDENDDENDDDNDDGGKTAVALTLLNALLATIYRDCHFFTFSLRRSINLL